MSALEDIQKRLADSKKSFSSLSRSIITRTKDSLEQDARRSSNLRKLDPSFPTAKALTPLLHSAAARGVLPRPIQSFADKDSNFVVDAARSLVFGDVKGNRKAFEIYDRAAAGKPITTDEKRILKEFARDQTLNLVGNTGGIKNVREPISSISDEVGKAAGKSAKSKYAFNINMNRMSLKEDTDKMLRETVDNIRPQLEAIRGGPITDDEVIQAAKSSQVIKKVIPREHIVQEAAEIKATDDLLKETANKFEILKNNPEKADEAARSLEDLIEQIKIVTSVKRKTGVLLEKNRLTKEGRPERLELIDDMIAKSKKAGEDLDDMIRASKDVDFTDMKSITNFYRKYVPATFMEKLNEYRYVNMLSAPKTHMVNAFSNIIQTAVRPVDKMASGLVDNIGARFTGKQRTAYVREVPEYTRGAINAIPDAVRDAVSAFSGKLPVDRPDIGKIPTGTGGLHDLYTIPLRALEASDVFFRKLISSGEYESLVYREMRKRGTNVLSPEVLSLLKKEADDVATKYVFRDEIGKAGQGALFNKMDRAVMALERIPETKIFVPFVRTPLNVLKQGIERTPVIGNVALIGAKNKQEILGRQLVGSTMFMYAGYLAMTDSITGATPQGSRDKARFFAEGKIPYSIRIGDTWIQYNKLGPLGYPFALAAGIKDAYENDTRKDKDGRLANISEGLAKMGEYFVDQSYVENIGALVDALRGDEYAKEKLVSNTASQFIPYDAFIRSVARLTDDVYRNPKNITENIMMNLPGLSKEVGAYRTPSGRKSRRSYNELNTILPANISKAKRKRR